MAQRDWVDKDYYAVLGVGKTASKEEIKKAYRKLAQQFHPDANKGDAGAEARFKEISEAHSILSNDAKRAEYDQMRSLIDAGGHRTYGFRPGHGGDNVRVDIGDIGDLFGGGGFEDLFGFRRPRRGSDMETEVSLSFEDAVAGTTVTVPGGTKVRIPPAVADGARIKVSGRGEKGGRNGEAGDLFVKVNVKPHPVFSLGKNGTLEVRVPITFPEAALGAKVQVPTLGAPVTVKIPPGTPHGKAFRVKGKGAPGRSGGQGDLIVRVEVAVPQKLSRKEKDLLEKFAAEHDEPVRAHLDEYLNTTEV
jgi:molecular chaperone DnaJ